MSFLMHLPLQVSDKYIYGQNSIVDQSGFRVVDVPDWHLDENMPDDKHWGSFPEYRRDLSPDEQFQLASLFAAAPDLLRACKAFVEAHDKSLQLEKTDQALALAKAAIEKAEPIGEVVPLKAG